jgi:hypothetical protein
VRADQRGGARACPCAPLRSPRRGTSDRKFLPAARTDSSVLPSPSRTGGRASKKGTATGPNSIARSLGKRTCCHEVEASLE